MRAAVLVLLLVAATVTTRTWSQAADAIGAPLPPRDQFLKEARETLARSQEVWHRYSYRERRTDVHMNPFGRMGTGETRVIEVRPSAHPGLTYRRVVERNGQPVPAHELERQDAEYRARAAQVRQRTAGSEDEEERQRADLVARRRAQMVIADVLDTLHFDLARREMRHGRPTIVISFAARPDARPATRQGRIAKVFKGNAWVDEASREVLQVEAEAVDDVSFGGFVAKLYEGTHASVRREQVDTGVWMPTRLSLVGDVRALFRKARIEYVVEWTDYRRLAEP
jgi:type II secretory pathway component PulJ